MTQTILSTINLCPINFKAFNNINKLTESIDATVLYSKLKFHQQNSKLVKSNKQCIARSRDQLASWFGFGLKKTDNLLSLLEKQGLIKKQSSLWYGKKRLFIHTNNATSEIPLNIKMLTTLANITGSIQNAIIFSKIAYAFNNTNIQHDDLLWCCIKKADLANWAGISIRSLDKVIQTFTENGLILKKNFSRYGKVQTHYHINTMTTKRLVLQFKLDVLKPKINKIITNSKWQNTKENNNKKCANSLNCRPQPAKKAVSIRIRSNSQKTINNTCHLTTVEEVPTTHIKKQSNIIFNTIATKLSYRQLKYLESALNRTVINRKITLSNPGDVWEQVKFAISNAQQRRGVQSFKHAVNRCMKILADGNWKAPIGFNTHSNYGVGQCQQREEKSKQWAQQKAGEISASRQYSELVAELNINHKQQYLNKQTEKAVNTACQLVKLSQSQLTDQIETLVMQLTSELQGMIRQGADYGAIKNILQPTQPVQ